MKVTTIDYHTAGEPLRIVTSGLPDLPGDTMAAKRRHMRDHHDDLRRLLMLEPRGHADMYGAVLTDPVTPDGDCGVLFLHNEGYSTMCGHGIIAMVTAAHEEGVFSFRDASAIRIDTPAGRVTAALKQDEDGLTVTFDNVPAFVHADAVPFKFGDVEHQATIAYGGAFYAYVDAASVGLPLEPSAARRMIDAGRSIKDSLANSVELIHPSGDPDLAFLYGVIFTGQRQGNRIREVCVFAEGELDRSPTGTGVSGLAAILRHRGELGLEERLTVESIIGTEFQVHCLADTRVAGLDAVLTQVSGQAFQTGHHQFVLSPGDPLREGLFIR